MFLQRNRFPGNGMLVAMLTFPLAFSRRGDRLHGDHAGRRQGLIGQVTQALTGEKLVFRLHALRPVHGLCLFLDPAHHPHRDGGGRKLDPKLEEAARSLGASPCAVVLDVIIPGLKPAFISAGAICFATAVGAFGTAFTLAAKINVLPMVIYTEFTLSANIAMAAALSFVLAPSPGSCSPWRAPPPAPASRRQANMKRRGLFFLQLGFTLFVCAFLIVPMILSIMAGLTVNYFVGIESGLTLRWVMEVWNGYRDTIFLSIGLALACLAATLVLGIPAAYVLAKRQNALTPRHRGTAGDAGRVPGLATALALIVTYGSLSGFPHLVAFILVGHVLFTLPFMVRSVLAVLMAIDLKTLEEGAARWAAGFWERFRDIVLPNCRQGILAGSLMVVTLSMGEFNMTWLLHTPFTKTLPVGWPTPMRRCDSRSAAPTRSSSSS